MNQVQLAQLLAAEMSLGVDDATVKTWVELARLAVAGDYDWQRLRHFDTLTTVANRSDYVLPDELDGAAKPLIDKFIGMRGRLDTDGPVELRNPDHFMQSIFNREAESLAIIEIGGGSAVSSLSAGQIKIRLRSTPTSAKIFDVLLKLPPPQDSFDFVPTNNQLVFLWRAEMMAYKKAALPTEQGGFNNAMAIYRQDLQAAIKNDYISPKEYIFMLPAQRWLDFQAETAVMTSRR